MENMKSCEEGHTAKPDLQSVNEHVTYKSLCAIHEDFQTHDENTRIVLMLFRGLCL